MKQHFRWMAAGLLLMIVVAGASLRLHDLQARSMWADELFTLAVAQYHPLVPAQGQPWFRYTSVIEIADGDTFLTVKAGEQSPPLYDLLVKLSVQLLGPTELGSRLPAAIAGCLLLLWWAWHAWRARDPWMRAVLTWGLLLLALNPAMVAFAREGRAYSLGAAMVGMALVPWLQRWHAGARRWSPPGWAEIVLMALACYSHYNALVMVGLLLAPDAVMAWRTRSRDAWVRLGTLAAVATLWIAVNAATIKFTAKGGVSWGAWSAADHVAAAARAFGVLMYLPWLCCGVALLLALPLLRGWPGLRSAVASETAQRLRLWSALCLMVVVQASIVAWVTFKAGMSHPRYYIFVLPVVMVMLAMVLARLRARWLVVGLALLLVGLAVPPRGPAKGLLAFDDFRAMARTAVAGADADTLFVFPWAPNRNMYRLYLERFLGGDPRTRMVATSSPDDAARVCERLGQHPHVVAIGHDSGHQRIDEVYAACGARWPVRERQQFHNVFTEHWRVASPAGLVTR